VSYTGKTGAALDKSVYQTGPDPTLHTDSFYIPVWMSDVLSAADDDKSAIVRDALRLFFEQNDMMPEEVQQR